MLKNPNLSTTDGQITLLPLADGLVYPPDCAANSHQLPDTSSLSIKPVHDNDGEVFYFVIGFKGICEGILEFNEAVFLSDFIKRSLKEHSHE